MAMGTIKAPAKVKLITGMISSEETLFLQSIDILSLRYGPADFVSESIPFDFTSYYEREMGKGLFRKFCSFKDLIDPGILADIKLFSRSIEMSFSLLFEGRKNRRINIDPGYIALSKLVLASTKDRSHRIYIGKGIYAEVTLQYEKRSFHPWHWTYPDFRSEDYVRICNLIRETYSRQLREW